MLDKLKKTIQKYNLIEEQDKIVIGVSGGPDSMCLLDSLYCLQKELGIEIVVAHINHMIRKEAEEETKYVKQYCEERKVPFYVKRADVLKMAKEQKLGTEAMGRQVRYDFFEEVAKKVGANKIATAHNANDNAETVLMNIIRGSGTSGLKGIEVKRKAYIRPLKECTRKEIEAYCEEKKLNPKIDQSNFENNYTRNKIRNILIPLLEEQFNPNMIETLNRLSEIAREEDEYFFKIVQKEYENLRIEENKKAYENRETEKNKNEYKSLQIGENEKEIILDLKKFNSLPKVIKSRLLLYTISKAIGDVQGIGKVHIEDIIKLCQNNIGNKYLTPNKRIKIFVKKGKIFFISKTNLP